MVVIGQRVCLQTCWLITTTIFKRSSMLFSKSNLARSFGYKHVAPSLTLNGKFSWEIFFLHPTGDRRIRMMQQAVVFKLLTYYSIWQWHELLQVMPLASSWRINDDDISRYQRSNMQSKHGRRSCILLLLGIISNYSFKERCSFGWAYVSTD